MRAIDAFVNVNMGSMERPDYLQRVAEDYFKRADEIFKDLSIAELLDVMDRCGVEKSVLSLRAQAPSKQVLAFTEARPDRFVLAAYLDPRRGMPALRELEAVVRAHPVVLARLVPFMLNLPPDDRVYYPVYAKCIELNLPVSVNTGIPGPPAPGKCQDPMFLDEVCLFFPELKLIMAHGADPWWQIAIRLMLKYQNLYLMTSAYAPRYFPPELLQFMNTRGQHKIMFASDHPVLSMERCIKEAQALDLREGVLDKFLYANAHAVLFPKSR
ncbi:MAG TPA: amidohydrolase family protein [Polyangia bacterium]|nr:amidohydrolase family protein [Polyangia bacterium]